jgi:hypothetical protein
MNSSLYSLRVEANFRAFMLWLCLLGGFRTCVVVQWQFVTPPFSLVGHNHIIPNDSRGNQDEHISVAKTLFSVYENHSALLAYFQPERNHPFLSPV